MKSLNLFGEIQEFEDTIKEKGVFAKFKQEHGYKRSDSPKTKSCGICAFVLYKRLRGKYYYKCKLCGDSNSASSDIRASCVCSLFKRTW